MIRSMTGFGRAEASEEGATFRVEVRTVNYKSLRVSTRLPELLSAFEGEIERVVRRHIARGAVHVALTYIENSPAVAYEINSEALHFYRDTLSRIQRHLGCDGNVRAVELLNLPGVLQPVSPTWEHVERIWKRFETLLDEALRHARKMREDEGQNLRAELLRFAENIRLSLDRIEELLPRVLEAYRERLHQRVSALLEPEGIVLDRDALCREVAIVAERSDIAEEIARLRSHLDQMMQALDADEPVGRKLEFLTQEMLREANTMGAKANDVQIAQIVLEIKGEIDRLREQVFNIE